MTWAIRLMMHLETLLNEHINLSPTASQPYQIQPEPGPWRSLADEQKATPNFYCGLRGQLSPGTVSSVATTNLSLLTLSPIVAAIPEAMATSSVEDVDIA